VVDEARDCMGGGDAGRCGALARPHPPVVGAQAIGAATDGVRREPNGLAGAMAGLQRAPASDLPPGALLVGGHASPGADGLRVGPLPWVQADCGEEGLPGAGIPAGHGDQSHPRQLIPQASGVIIGGRRVVGAVRVRPVAQGPLIRPYGLDRLKAPVDGGIALPHRLGRDVIQGERRRQRQDMLGWRMPRQRLGHLRRAARSAGRPQARQVDGMPLAGHHGADHGQPCGAGEVGQPLGELDVHRVPRLGHGRARRRPIRQPGRPMAPVGPHGTPRGRRAT
jgi:hypothetical protein